MTDRISIPALRDELDWPRNQQHRVVLLALVEAVEAARLVRIDTFGNIPPSDLNRLRDALARFDFGEQRENEIRQLRGEV